MNGLSRREMLAATFGGAAVLTASRILAPGATGTRMTPGPFGTPSRVLPAVSFPLVNGVWIARWIDSATGRELARSQAASTDVLPLTLPAGPDHRIVHLEKKAL